MTDENCKQVLKATEPNQIDSALKKLLRRKNPAQLKKLAEGEKKEDQSLSKYDIMHITKRALEDQKQKKVIRPEIYSTIKGRPYCLKLGEIDPTVDNFKGFYDTFYTNIYAVDRQKPRYSLRQMRPPTPNTLAKQKTQDKENSSQRMKSMSSSKASQTTYGSMFTEKKDNKRYFRQNFTNFINDCSQMLEDQNGNKRRSLVKYPTVNPFRGRM